MSAGSYGVVHEPTASGPLNADALDDTNNVQVNTAMFLFGRERCSLHQCNYKNLKKYVMSTACHKLEADNT